MDRLSEAHRFRRVHERLATSGQPTESQLEAAAREGVEVVINLALHDDPRYSLADERSVVESSGMTYVHIPVRFDDPQSRDFVTFCAAMDAHHSQHCLVHCASNYRVPAFLGLYWAIRKGQPPDTAFALMHEIWTPNETWATFIGQTLHELGATLRPATVDDAKAIVDLHFAAVHHSASTFYPSEVLHNWSPAPNETRYGQIQRAIANSDELFLVADDASGVIGFGSIVPASQELHAVDVNPRAGRRGVGSMILRHLEALARERGASHLQVDASLNSEEFYRRAGYASIVRSLHVLRSGYEMPCVRMKKALRMSHLWPLTVD